MVIIVEQQLTGLEYNLMVTALVVVIVYLIAGRVVVIVFVWVASIMIIIVFAIISIVQYSWKYHF